ncbi:MAG: 50S ribosomal protein L3 N(5)-glutamine methyltransferase [Proteobacteria bacterium]|nr:MAG: 50S ribosomal protein L3 N(5)-glutamine methyltransferase [Pseudomonadota bacterium]
MWADARSRLQTLRDLLRFAVSRFGQAELSFGHGTDTAYDEAAYLILHTLALPLNRLEPFLDARLLPEEIDQVLGILHRRVEDRIPAAYLTREAWLGEYRFYVDERVIVPRSHIGSLLAHGLGTWVDPANVSRALDLCTGSGCLAILLADLFESAKVDAADISTDALEVARRNVSDYGLDSRVQLVQSDLFSALIGARYDVIVSNPPYVTLAAMEQLPEEYRREPPLALAGGPDGLDVVRRTLNQAKRFLSQGGVMIVEVGDGREALESAYPEIDFTWLETNGVADRVFLLERGQLPN